MVLNIAAIFEFSRQNQHFAKRLLLKYLNFRAKKLVILNHLEKKKKILKMSFRYYSYLQKIMFGIVTKAFVAEATSGNA